MCPTLITHLSTGRAVECGSALVSIRIQIQLFISMRIRVKGAESMRIHAEPDPGSDFIKSQKLNCYLKNILKEGNRSLNIPTKTVALMRIYSQIFSPWLGRI
jgi:hypothetical protein